MHNLGRHILNVIFAFFLRFMINLYIKSPLHYNDNCYHFLFFEVKKLRMALGISFMINTTCESLTINILGIHMCTWILSNNIGM